MGWGGAGAAVLGSSRGWAGAGAALAEPPSPARASCQPGGDLAPRLVEMHVTNSRFVNKARLRLSAGEDASQPRGIAAGACTNTLGSLGYCLSQRSRLPFVSSTRTSIPPKLPVNLAGCVLQFLKLLQVGLPVNVSVIDGAACLEMSCKTRGNSAQQLVPHA